MSNGTIPQISSYESFLSMDHQVSSQRYSITYQSNFVSSQDKCWEENGTGIKEEQFVDHKETPVYSRYHSSVNQSVEMPHDPTMSQNNGESYLYSDYVHPYSATTTPMYPSFQAPTVGSRSQASLPGSTQVSGASTRSLYMPPTPPSSEPGSPSTQQQQQMQSRNVAMASHHLKTGAHSTTGLIHTTNAYLSTSNDGQVKQPSPPPFSSVNGKSTHAQLTHFTEASQVSPISSSHLNNGTIPVPFSHSAQQCHNNSTGSEGPKVSHSTSMFTGGRANDGPQYNTVVGQISASVHPRYNRRNNPELEKRRIHRCDYPG